MFDNSQCGYSEEVMDSTQSHTLNLKEFSSQTMSF